MPGSLSRGPNPNYVRSFVAVEIPDDVRADIGRLISHLRARNYPVRWVSPGNLHLTLMFLGENPPDFTLRVRECLMRATTGVAEFSMSLSGLGAFPNERSARVVWLGVEKGRGELTSLAERVKNELATVGFVPDRASFSAHLTIGRVRERLSDARSILERPFAAHPFLVTCIVHLRSTLQPGGPVYEELAAFPLESTKLQVSSSK